MAQAQHYATQYQEIEVKTADQFELVLLLYKGAVKHLKFAKKYMLEGDIEKRVGSNCGQTESTVLLHVESARFGQLRPEH